MLRIKFVYHQSELMADSDRHDVTSSAVNATPDRCDELPTMASAEQAIAAWFASHPCAQRVRVAQQVWSRATGRMYPMRRDASNMWRLA
jgi:hypothetical protein